MNENGTPPGNLGALARSLMTYHRHSFRARKYKMVSGNADPPIVAELDNWRRHETGDYSNKERLVRLKGYVSVIEFNRDRIAELRKEAKEVDEMGGDASPFLKKARVLYAEMKAARALMEKERGNG